MNIFNTIANDSSLSNNDFVLILEDDIDTLPASFEASYNTLLKTLRNDQTWDIHYLGTFHEDIAIYDDPVVHPNVRRLGGNSRTFGGGSHAYFIRKRAAIIIMEALNDNYITVTQAIDWFLLSTITSLNLTQYKSIPNLMESASVLEERSRVGESDVGAIGQSTKHNDRLLHLLHLSNDDVGHLGEVLFEIAQPDEAREDEHNPININNDDEARIKISISTSEDPTLLMERHQGSMICGKCKGGANDSEGGEGDEVCYQLADSGMLSLDRLVDDSRISGVCNLRVRLITMFGSVVAENERQVEFRRV